MAVALVRGGGETILVVEDNIELRRVVVRQLKGFGYQAIEAEGAAVALEVLRSRKVDLLFTDIVMPGQIDGFELARQAFALSPTIKVVFTSGFPEAKVNGQFGPLAKAVRLLSKPYRKEELGRTLREVLDG